MPLRGLNGRTFSRFAAAEGRRRARRFASHAAICACRHWECADPRSQRRRTPLGTGDPSHRRRASRCAGSWVRAGQPAPLAPAHAFAAVCRPGSFLLHGCQVPGPMALILRCHRGRVDHAPYLPFAVVLTPQHAHQLADVQRLALGPPLATIARNRGGISPGVEDPLGRHKPMPPEAFAARFVTTDHRRGCRPDHSAIWPGRLRRAGVCGPGPP